VGEMRNAMKFALEQLSGHRSLRNPVLKGKYIIKMYLELFC
jgi:hypothetical protein